MMFAEENTTTEQGKQPYKYNGKELDQTHELNQYDYSARHYDPGYGRFTTVDPLAEKYYTISPYAYVANNLLKYVDIKGDSLTLVGNQNHLDEVIDVHNANIGANIVTIDSNTGIVSMPAFSNMDTSNMTPEQIACTRALDGVVNGTDGMTSINVVKDSEVVPIGLAATKTIDIGDIQKIGQGNVSSGTTLIHETWEQYRMQVGGVDINRAHFQAIRVENSISGKQSLGGQFVPDYVNPRTGVQSSSGVLVVPFQNAPSTIIRMRNNNVLTPIIR